MSSADSHHLTGHHAEAQPPGLHRRSQSSQCLTALPSTAPAGPRWLRDCCSGRKNKRTTGTFGKRWRHQSTQTAVLGWGVGELGRGVPARISLRIQAERDALSLNRFVSFWGFSIHFQCLIRLVSLIFCGLVSQMCCCPPPSTPPFHPCVYVLKLFKSLNTRPLSYKPETAEGWEVWYFIDKRIKKQNNTNHKEKNHNKIYITGLWVVLMKWIRTRQ